MTFNDYSISDLDNILVPGNLMFSEMHFYCSGFVMREHLLKEKCNETRKVIEKGLMNAHASVNGDGGMFQDDDVFGDDDSFKSLDSNDNSVSKTKVKGCLKT